MNEVPEDPFAHFASRYDLMPERGEVRKEFLRKIIDQYGLMDILDCACGTGNDLMILHSLGARVTGSDVSPAMLKIASEKLRSENINVPLHNIDFRELAGRFNTLFDAVLCLSTSLPQLSDEDAVLMALKSIHSALKRDGILVITQGMSDKNYNSRDRFLPLVNTRDFSRIMVIDYFESTWDANIIDVIHDEKDSSFNVYNFKYLKLLKDDYLRLLKEAGFRETVFYGNFEFEPYSKESSEYLIIVAR